VTRKDYTEGHVPNDDDFICKSIIIVVIIVVVFNIFRTLSLFNEEKNTYIVTLPFCFHLNAILQ
jgi:hypothetical protein